MSMEAHGRREVRRVHIIYFISRNGRIDHPHLLRVHHFCGNGVRLRDIKRWLAVVRGEDMPESYSWSYKRRYKTGYVWQDSLDEDLITPLSDNEYVIKGSEFGSSTVYDDSSVAVNESSNVEANKSNDQNSEATQTVDDETKQLRDIHEAPITTLINDSTKDEEETKHLISRNEEDRATSKKRNDVRFRLNFLKKNKNTTKSKKFHVNLPSEMPDSSASELVCSPKKNARNLFRRMIACGMVDAKDSAIKSMREALE